MISAFLIFEAAPGARSPAVLAPLLPFFATALMVVFGIALYNRLIRARMRTREAWPGIDVQLKRRASLIPNLVETVRGYTRHEHKEKIAYARQFYNQNVMVYNTSLQSSPAVLFARWFRFEPVDFYAAEPVVAQDLKVDFTVA